MNYFATVDGQEYQVSLEESGRVTVDGSARTVDLQSIDGGFHYSLLVGAASVEAYVERCEDVCFVTIEGHRYQVRVEDARLRRAGRRQEAVIEAGEADVTSPMPGLVVAVLVEPSQEVRTGEGLLILDAPPGTACPVIETLRGADVALLVTEPTAFGLHDLRLAVEVARDVLRLPVAVVINKDGAGDSRVEDYCHAEGLPVLLRIPLRREIAVAYSSGEPLIRAMPEYGPAFRTLLADLERLAQGRPR